MPPRRSPRTSPRTSPKGKSKEITISQPATSWSDTDVTGLLDLAIKEKAQAGDGTNFKPQFWTNAAAALSDPSKGIIKTSKQCKENLGDGEYCTEYDLADLTLLLYNEVDKVIRVGTV
ncbi:hypothetical protein PAXINDRAFT_18080 [Paxillus involutus ATCC 200175]|uniref:Myb/SANT-like domain-containing protein n=1 Tax=Paxillus involutus ATCC 200175 TaxID=664439 RepID=A0A0C9TNJ3_PAXIN|nr:hypothetical protein PAXINDRAFT_18080 [Paxillus involutus ATCC 200175]